MSQHDMNLANAAGATFRSDLNNALGALVTLSSGATAPSTTFASMLWYDTADDLLKMRNEANDAWITLLKLDQGNGRPLTVYASSGSVSAPAFSFINDIDTGLYLSSTNVLGVAAGGAVPATFNSTGLTMSGQLRITPGASYGDALLAYATSTNNIIGTIVPRASDESAYLRWVNNAFSAQKGSIGNVAGDMQYRCEGGSHEFYMTGTKKAWFTDGGSFVLANVVDVGSGSSDGLTAYTGGNTHISRNGEIALYLRRRSSDGAIQAFYRDTTIVGNISVTTTATAYNTSSDYRIKEDWRPLTKPALDTLRGIPIYSLKYKANPGQRLIGFLAHEIQERMPEAVTGEKDAVEDVGSVTAPAGFVLRQAAADEVLAEDEIFIPAKENKIVDGKHVEVDAAHGHVALTKKRVIANAVPKNTTPEGCTWSKTGTQPVLQQVDYSKIVPALIAAVQELAAKNDELEARILTLESA